MSDRKDILPASSSAIVPDWLEGLAPDEMGLDSVADMRIIPQARIVQGMTPGDITDELEGATQGAIYLMAGGVPTPLANKGESFSFVPLYFQRVYMAWNDRKDADSPAVHEQTRDKHSQLAAACRNRTEEKYGPDGKYTRRYQEHIVVFCLLYHPGSPSHLEPFSFSFARTAFKAGIALGDQSFRRAKEGPFPLWALVWDMTTTRESNNQGEWFNWKQRVPDDAAKRIIRKEDADRCRAAFQEIKELSESNTVDVDYTEEARKTSEADTPAADESAF